MLGWVLILLGEFNLPELPSSKTRNRWMNKLSIFPTWSHEYNYDLISRSGANLFSFARWYLILDSSLIPRRSPPLHESDLHSQTPQAKTFQRL